MYSVLQKLSRLLILFTLTSKNKDFSKSCNVQHLSKISPKVTLIEHALFGGFLEMSHSCGHESIQDLFEINLMVV